MELLKRTCQRKGCKNILSENPAQKYCSKKCQNKQNYQKNLELNRDDILTERSGNNIFFYVVDLKPDCALYPEKIFNHLAKTIIYKTHGKHF